MDMSSVRSDTLFTLLKGEPGTRKSTHALSYPTPQYWFNIDEKMEALRIPMKNWGIKPNDIEFDKFSGKSSGANEIIKKMETLQVNCKYKTIIVDSITSAADRINRQTMSIKSGTTNKEGGEKGARIGGIPVNSIEDYKAEASFFMEMIAILKDISSFHHVNIILIAHVIGARKPDEASNSVFSRIIVTGGQIISAKIPAYCTEIYHFNVEPNADLSKEGDYVALTRHTGTDYARTSLPLEPKLLMNANPLYTTHILPAIKKLDNQIPIEQPKTK